ncbi:MAG: M20/M25/M40 family metallo-hydrolase [Isosphaeraceae bacterium]
MNRRDALTGMILAVLLGIPPARAGEAAALALESRLTRDVQTLCAPEFQGRRGAGGRRASELLVERFRKLGLTPLFGDAFTQSIPDPAGIGIIGRNVGAMLRGSDEKLRDEYVIVSAHYDHLGKNGELIYPGADDNASGVAMMLELARHYSEAPTKPRRSLIFVGFDLEEAGLFGSRFFVEHAPVSLNAIKLFLTADMIGRSLGGVCKPYVFVMGSEHAPSLRKTIEKAGTGEPVKVGLLGSDILLLARSDYGPFMSRKIPYLFFSTGENPLYHTPGDRPETLDYPKLTSITRIIQRTVSEAADLDTIPAWSQSSPPAVEEAAAIRDVLRTLLDHRDELEIGGATALIMRNALKTLDLIVERGAFTPEERTAVIRIARIILISIF